MEGSGTALDNAVKGNQLSELKKRTVNLAGNILMKYLF